MDSWYPILPGKSFQVILLSSFSPYLQWTALGSSSCLGTSFLFLQRWVSKEDLESREGKKESVCVCVCVCVIHPLRNQLLRNREPSALSALPGLLSLPRVYQDGTNLMRRKLQPSWLNNNPFPSLRNNEETFFSLPWHRENNISDLCCLVIQSPSQHGSFSRPVILTLRAEYSSLFLSGGVFAFPSFIWIDCEVFYQKNKKDHVLEEPVTELTCWSMNRAGVGICILGLEWENDCWKIPGEGEVLTDSLGVRVPPQSYKVQIPDVHPRKCWRDQETCSTRHFYLSIALHLFVQFISGKDITLRLKKKQPNSKEKKKLQMTPCCRTKHLKEITLKVGSYGKSKKQSENVPLMNSITAKVHFHSLEF